MAHLQYLIGILSSISSAQHPLRRHIGKAQRLRHRLVRDLAQRHVQTGFEVRVVDAALRVHGVQGLRVVDASVFRSVTSVNTQAPTVMLAWKAAGFIMAGD